MNEKPLKDHPRFKGMDRRKVKKEIRKWNKMGITKFIVMDWHRHKGINGMIKFDLEETI